MAFGMLMIHKQIEGKKRQKNVEHSLNYILRVRPTDTEENRKFVQVMTTTTRADIENFNDYIKDDSRIEKVILPMRDGLTVIRKL